MRLLQRHEEVRRAQQDPTEVSAQAVRGPSPGERPALSLSLVRASASPRRRDLTVWLRVTKQKMLRVKDEEMSQSGGRGRGLSRKWSGHHAEEEEEEEEEDDEAFSESELELYEQYKAAGYKDLVRVCLRTAGGPLVACCVTRPPPRLAAVAQRGRGPSAGHAAEEGREGQTRQKAREEGGEKGAS